jgi:hypothetical protein
MADMPAPTPLNGAPPAPWGGEGRNPEPAELHAYLAANPRHPGVIDYLERLLDDGRQTGYVAGYLDGYEDAGHA